jgi:NAD(P)-dependent dehydrogenase (short-subunit alcohol dehydrogenase family)
MTITFSGQVAVVTGAGAGLGRLYALDLARRGARLVINDPGGSVHGEGSNQRAASAVVDEITALGGEATASFDSVASPEGGAAIVQSALDAFGRLDVVINNAGILCDRALHNMTIDEWREVLDVHLNGAFFVTHAAFPIMREQGYGRIVFATSNAGLFGNFGQANYGAAKAGIAGFTIIAALELAGAGATANAVAPAAATRLTAPLMQTESAAQIGPEHISPLVAWLASEQSQAVTGRVFDVAGGRISVAEGWRIGPEVTREGAWDPAELGAVIPDLVDKAAPNVDMSGRIPEAAGK